MLCEFENKATLLMFTVGGNILPLLTGGDIVDVLWVQTDKNE